MESNKKIPKLIKIILVLAFWLALWEGASLLVANELKLFLPGPLAVLKKWAELALTKDFLIAAGATLLRIFIGFLLGVIGGLCIGLLTANSKIFYALISPVLKIIRAVPVVSFIILAFLFIHVDRLPIFISFLMVLPLIWQTVHDGLSRTDASLMEMCRVFRIGKIKTLFRIQLPQCLPEIISAAVSALGFAWKSGVAAEVLCTPAVSLGHRIYSAKAALSFDEVYAVTLTVVLLSILIEMLLKYICNRCLQRKGGAL